MELNTWLPLHYAVLEMDPRMTWKCDTINAIVSPNLREPTSPLLLDLISHVVDLKIQNVPLINMPLDLEF